MAGYIRQSSFVDGDTITAALFNNEYNQLLNAFNNATGHAHDGTTAEGPVIGLIGDAGETAPNNKVLIDTTNNFVEFYVQVSSAPVQQLYIADGAIIPVTDSDIDLGTSSLYFKNAYIDSITTTGNIDVGGNLTVTGTTTFNGGTITMGDAATDNVVFGADINSSIIPNTDDTYDLGSASQEWRNLYIDGTANIDSLVADTADINGGTIDGSIIGGTTAAAITGTAITGTSFVIGSADISEAELETIDGVTAGTVAASKAIVVDANKDITGGRNITITGEIDAATLDISGNADIDGTLEADAITIGGITLAETIADTVGAMVSSNTETGIAVSYDDADNTLDFVIGDDAIVQSMIADDAIDSQHYVDGSIDLVHMSANSVDSDQYVDGSIDLIHMSANSVDSDQYVDGSIDTVHLADDAVTGAKLADNIDIAGTLDVTGILTADSNVVVAGNLTVNGTTTTLNTATLDVEDKNITINYGAGDTSASANGAGITIQDAIDASNDATILWDTTNDEFDFSHAINVAGKVTSTGTSVFANLDISGDVDVDGTLEADAITVAGVTLAETISDTVGAMVSSNTESGITVTYDDADNTLDFTVGTLNQNTTGSAATLTTPRAIAVAGDVTGTANFDGSAAISITTTLATDAIVTANITDANVTVAKMAANSVDSDQYVDGSIDTIHIADDAVTGAKIENAVTIATSVTSPLVDAQNFKINGGQGTDGQVLTSTGSGVAWEAGGGGASAINDLSDAKTFGTGSIMIGDATTGTIDAADNNTGLGVDVFAALTSGDGNVAVGFAALTANTTGNHNVSIGKDALAANVTAHRATAVGYQALKTSNVSGNSNSGNTAVGFEAGTAMTTGIANTLVGALAGDAITTGSYNTAVGYDALTANTTGGENTAFGFTALQNNTTAGFNTGLGRASLEANTEGAHNTGVGHAALGACTTGNQNVAVGNFSLNTSVEGNYQTAVGYQALKTSNYTANVYAYNTAVGWNAGLANTTGKVTAVGAAALTSNTTGINNAAFGGATDAQGAALEDNTTGSNNTAFGYAALRNNTTAGDNTAFGAAALSVNTTGAFNTALGRQALELNTTAANNTAVGYYALRANTTGTNNAAFGYQAGSAITTGSRNTVIGSSASAGNANDTIAIGYNVEMGSTGWISMGSGSTSIRVPIDGSTTSWSVSSDERLKTNVGNFNVGLDFINNLNPITFNWKKEGEVDSTLTSVYKENSEKFVRGFDDSIRVGFLAQDIKEQVDAFNLPNGFKLWQEDSDGIQGVADGELIPMFVNAIKELSAKNDALEARLTALEG
jgi:trimeric autotransporter adhesin